MVMAVGCNKSTVVAELGPKEVTDVFLSTLFEVDDYQIVNATTMDEAVMRGILKLAPIEDHATFDVLKTLHGNRHFYFVEEVAQHYNGKSKWITQKLEIRNQTADSSTVWYTGEVLIVDAAGTETRLPGSGTTNLKHGDTGWVIQGNKFLTDPLEKTIYNK
jgi:hypothetical protein